MESHQDPGQVHALHGEAIHGDLHVRHKLAPNVNDAEKERTLHGHVVVGESGVQHANRCIEEKHRPKVGLLLAKVLLDSAHRVVEHHHAKQE